MCAVMDADAVQQLLEAVTKKMKPLSCSLSLLEWLLRHTGMRWREGGGLIQHPARPTTHRLATVVIGYQEVASPGKTVAIPSEWLGPPNGLNRLVLDTLGHTRDAHQVARIDRNR